MLGVHGVAGSNPAVPTNSFVKKTSLILVSNDDGYQAPGICILTAALRRLPGVSVVVVAPDGEQSASSHSLTLHRPLRVYRHAKDEYSVDGTPTDSITLAVHEILPRKPDLIVSGINRGANLGDDVHYSGTVSAAVEGALLGIKSIAVSLVSWGEGPVYFEAAARIATRLVKKVLGETLPRGFVLNVNVPNLPYKELKGIALTRLGKRNYGDIIFKKMDPRGKKYYWIGGDERTFKNIPGSDGNVILEKKVSVTPLQVDLTHFALLEEMAAWKI